MIIAPDDPGEWFLSGSLEAEITDVFDGDGFLASVFHPIRQTWLRRVPFRFAFIDAPEMAQPSGLQSRDFLRELITGKRLRLDPVGKQSTGYTRLSAGHQSLQNCPCRAVLLSGHPE